MSTWKRVGETENYWELSGESVLTTDALINQPEDGKTTIRLTHSNVYCPIEGVNLSIRVGDENDPTPWDKPETRNDWIPAVLVEELLLINDVEIERSKVNTPIDMEEETPWDATYDIELSIPKGEHLIEIKVESQDEYFMSGVLSDWKVAV